MIYFKSLNGKAVRYRNKLSVKKFTTMNIQNGLKNTILTKTFA